MSEPRAHYASDHAQQRAIERLGFAPTVDQWRSAALAIMDSVDGRARALLVQRDRDCEQWRVHIGGRAALVVWSPTRAIVVTVLS